MLYRTILAIYGLINIAGGLFAFLSPKVQSVWSLIVGGTSGVLFIIFAILAGSKPGIAFRSAAALCMALACFWVFRIIEVNGQGKSPMMANGNLILALAVFGTLGIGHMVGMKRTRADHNE